MLFRSVKTCPACGAEAYAASADCECGFVFPIKDDARHGEQADKDAALLEAQQKPQRFEVIRTTWQKWHKKQAGSEAPPTLRVNYEVIQPEEIPVDGFVSNCDFECGDTPWRCPKCFDNTFGVKWKLRPDTPHFAECRCSNCGHFVKWLSKSHKCFSSYTNELSQDVISEWVCLQHEGFARTKALLWWQAHSFAPAPRTIDEALSLLDRHAVAMPRSIVAKKEGQFWRIISQDVDEKPEQWRDVEEELQPASVGGDSGFGDDEEVPF